ncbi:MAG: dihydroneopterin aldolase [Bacteroidales bacterium]|nr:dihydroneopterin aldolase [Bacteroidales bacterium]
MGMISVEGMEFFAYHGCFAEEQVIGTRFIVDFYFEADTSDAEVSDDLRQTVNYQTVYQLVKKEMEIKAHLLEHVAHRILKSVMNNFPAINAAEVKISKLNPPLGGKVDKVCVTLSTDDWTDAEPNT